ncbi:MAG: hypothetical protein K0Q66_1403 [Chitinophagaceae bacterium]|nr:hypothetical protein [Chitinophagaceae bacterium]
MTFPVWMLLVRRPTTASGFVLIFTQRLEPLIPSKRIKRRQGLCWSPDQQNFYTAKQNIYASPSSGSKPHILRYQYEPHQANSCWSGDQQRRPASYLSLPTTSRTVRKCRWSGEPTTASQATNKGVRRKYFIDKSGILRFQSGGFSTDAELVNEIDAMISILKGL